MHLQIDIMIETISLYMLHFRIIFTCFNKLAEYVSECLYLSQELKLFLFQRPLESSGAPFRNEIQQLTLGTRILVLQLRIALLQKLIQIIPQCFLRTLNS
jgi:hypothetical protein